MGQIGTIQALASVFTDVLAGPYLLGYIIVGLGLMTLSGPLMLLGTVMIGVPLIVAGYLALTE